jgi:hypothetical protein
MLVRENLDAPHFLEKAGLSGYLVYLVHLVSLMQPNKLDRPNRPNEQGRLADFFSILLETIMKGPWPVKVGRVNSR